MNNRRLSYVVVLLLLAFALRMVALDSPALRGDEAFSVYAWAGPLDQVFSSMALTEPHPPLTYITFSGWVALAGQSELGVRYLSVLSSMVTVAALYAIGQRLGGHRLAITAGLLAATNPFQIWHAQDARNYALWAALSATALWLMLRADRASGMLLYIVIEVAALYTFYLEVFVLAVHNLYRLLTRQFTRRWLVAQLAVGTALAGLFFYFLNFVQDGGYHATAQPFDPALLFTWFVPTLSAGDTLPTAVTNLLWPVMLTLLGVGWWLLWRNDRRAAILTGLLGLAPLVLLGLIATRMAVFRPRYVLASAPAYTLALAGLVAKIGRDRRRLGYAILAGLLTINSATLLHHYTDPTFRKSPGWRELVAYLDARATPNDLLVQNEPDPAINYYYQGKHTIAPLSAGSTPAETADQLEAALQNHTALWFLPSGHWDPEQTALGWLEDHAQQISDAWVGGFRVQQWRAWAVTPAELDTIIPAEIAANDFAQLAGYSIDLRPGTGGVVQARPGTRLTLLLYWAPEAAAPVDYTVFAHLVGPVNPVTGTPLWVQDDHPPQHGRAPTSTWTPGVVLRDVFTLDLVGIPPGEYAVQVGLYNPANKERVALKANGEPVEDDAARLFEVHILEP